MKKIVVASLIAMAAMGCLTPVAAAQDSGVTSAQHADTAPPERQAPLRKFMVERTIPGLGDMTAEEFRAITAASNAVLDELGVRYHWVQSYVTGDKMYCIHIAPDEETVREHARRGGFPVDRITEITGTIDPTTARTLNQ